MREPFDDLNHDSPAVQRVLDIITELEDQMMALNEITERLIFSGDRSPVFLEKLAFDFAFTVSHRLSGDMRHFLALKIGVELDDVEYTSATHEVWRTDMTRLDSPDHVPAQYDEILKMSVIKKNKSHDKGSYNTQNILSFPRTRVDAKASGSPLSDFVGPLAGGSITERNEK
ncbi:MAG: hypothetical protein COB49_00505 [Alphaproteobacteria bacterium]|nr:MAG: hypothetical protein COB49_00505 [Alphaproteobacteria bacterium]